MYSNLNFNVDHALGQKLLLEGYLEAYEGLCSIKKVAFITSSSGIYEFSHTMN